MTTFKISCTKKWSLKQQNHVLVRGINLNKYNFRKNLPRKRKTPVQAERMERGYIW